MPRMVTAASSKSDRDRAVRRVLWITLGLNVLVAAAKVAYGAATDALSIQADGFHSLADGLNNVVALVAIRLAARPADDNHPYGHQKLEIFAAALIGVVLFTTALEVLRSAAWRIAGYGPPVPTLGTGAFWVLGLTLGVNLAVAVYEQRAAQRLQSPILQSDAAHTLSDIAVTGCVLLATLLTWLGYPAWDGLVAVLVAAWIAWTGYRILRQNAGYLADEARIDPAVVDAALANIPGLASAHKIRTRGTPGHVFLDLHIQIARHLDVVQAHQLTHRVIDAIREAIPGIQDITVHTEPAHPDQTVPPFEREG